MNKVSTHTYKQGVTKSSYKCYTSFSRLQWYISTMCMFPPSSVLCNYQF